MISNPIISKMSNKKQSGVWKYFKHGKEKDTVICEICSSLMSCKQSSTSALKRHLATKHRIDITEPANEEPQPKKMKTMESFMKRTTLEEIVAKMAAIDGISIRAITKSEEIRMGISSRGFKLPKSESAVMELVHNFAKSKKQEIIQEIESEVSGGLKFSITLDEWTSFATRRYLNINLHKTNSSVINLGLVRILGSCNAEKMVDIVENHLKSFKISYEHDIVAATGDGASVMTAFGRRSAALYQICLGHGLHLGVFHTLYKKIDNSEENNIENSENQEDDDFEDAHEHEDSIFQFGSDRISKNIDRVRQIVKFFKFSAIRRDLLSSKVKARFNSGEQLSLDCQTRWNSLLFMLEKFLKLYEVVVEALNELGAENLLQSINVQMLKTLVDCLKPVEVAMNAISESGATLRTADIAIDFMMTKLRAQSNDIGVSLLENLTKYMDRRLDTKLIELQKALHQPDIIPSKVALEFGISLLKRLFPQIEIQDEEETNTETQTVPALTLDEELRQLLEADKPSEKQSPENFSKLKQEFSLFRSTGKRTHNIQCLFNAINTIKPTSIEAENLLGFQ